MDFRGLYPVSANGSPVWGRAWAIQGSIACTWRILEERYSGERAKSCSARGNRTLNLAGAKQLPDLPYQTMVNIDADAGVPEGSDFWLRDKAGTYALKVGVNTIGRLPDNDVVLSGEFVSRRHCAILVHAGEGCEVYDIASKNGTFINGARLSGPCLSPPAIKSACATAKSSSCPDSTTPAVLIKIRRSCSE